MAGTGAQLTQVRAVLVASFQSSGAEETGTSTSCPALLPLAGTCALDYWLEACRSCHRLEPLIDKLLVVGSTTHQQHLQGWAAAAGLPGSCVISTNTNSKVGLLQALTAAAAACCDSIADSHVLLIDAGYVLEPGSSLSRLVEAAVVRGKDTVTVTVPFEGGELQELVQVYKEDANADSSHVSGMNTAATGTADGSLDTIMGPVCVLHPDTMSALQAAAAAVTQPTDPHKELGAFLQQQIEQGRAIYSINLPFFFSINNPQDCVLTNAFFNHYHGLQESAKRQVQQLAVGIEGAAAGNITGTVGSLVTKLQTLGARQPPSPARQQLMATVDPTRSRPPASPARTHAPAGTVHLNAGSTAIGAGSNAASSSLKRMFAQFYDKWQEQMTNEAQQATTKDYTILPARFESPDRWDLKAKKQHPCYSTSSNDYGAKRPTAFDMPLVWTGIEGKFTDTFHGGCYRAMGLKSSVERSRVHRSLDYL